MLRRRVTKLPGVQKSKFWSNYSLKMFKYSRIVWNYPFFGLKLRLLFNDLFRIRFRIRFWIRIRILIRNVYFGVGSDSDPDKSLGSLRIRFRIRIRNTAFCPVNKLTILFRFKCGCWASLQEDETGFIHLFPLADRGWPRLVTSYDMVYISSREKSPLKA